VSVAISTTYKLLVTAKYEEPGVSTRGADGENLPGFSTPIIREIPFVWVEVLRSDGSSVAGAYANPAGQVIFSGLDPAIAYSLALQSKTRQNGFDLWVVNNKSPIDKTKDTVRARYAPYKDRVAYEADKKKANQTTDLVAKIGWDSATQKLDDRKRVSAPYAILRDLNETQILVSSVAPTSISPSLTVLWTPTNKGGSTSFVPDFDIGLVRSGGFFNSGYSRIDTSGKSTGAFVEDNIIYLSGDQAFELMEFGGFVTVHEIWHWIQKSRFRHTRLGGEHNFSEYQDLRLVWSEGFADAMPPLVRKSALISRFAPYNGKVVDNVFDYSKDIPSNPKGWFQELIVPRLVWSIYDPTGTIKLSTAKILEPLFSPEWASGKWPTNLWAYGKILKDKNPSAATAIDAAAAALNITLAGNDEWGSTETVLGNLTQAQTLPIFTLLSPGQSKTVCSVGAPQQYNKLSNSRFFRVTGDSVGRTLRVTVPTGTKALIKLDYFEKTATSNIVGSPNFSWIMSSDNAITGIYPNGGEAVISVGDCQVNWSEDPADANAACGVYTPPSEQCFTVSLQ